MKKSFTNFFNNIISIENLLKAWKRFSKGKEKKEDVQDFQKNLMVNIISLYNQLNNRTYVHGSYEARNISDPKPRNIHKAEVSDRLLHHAIYRILYPFFDKKFISDSWSCRNFKGTHKALNRFRDFARKVSKNNTKQCWVLKCDVRKFFASIDQEVLIKILKENIKDQNIIWLLEKIISSFFSIKEGVGLPLGNLTSQLLVNIYMNKFDTWIKHRMRVKYYVRYADDFVILSQDKDYLLELTYKIGDFLEEELKLTLHPDKLFIKTLSSGADFLGWVHFPNYRVLRTATKKKMFRNLNSKEGEKLENSKASYLGMLKWGNGYKLSQKIS